MRSLFRLVNVYVDPPETICDDTAYPSLQRAQAVADRKNRHRHVLAGTGFSYCLVEQVGGDSR